MKQSDYMLYDGIHDAIISETDWREAHNKRRESGFKREKVHSLDHEHILSGILRCPVCGAGMYGNVNRKKKPDGSSYEISLDIPVMTDDERQIILDGCLINYYRAENK